MQSDIKQKLGEALTLVKSMKREATWSLAKRQFTKAGSDTNIKSILGWTSLMAAEVKGHTEIMDMLRQAGTKQ